MEIGLMAYLERGKCYMEMLEYKKAIQDFSVVLFHEPKCKEALLNRGKCYLELGKLDK